MRALAVCGALLLAAACGPKASSSTAEPGNDDGAADLTCEQVAEQLGNRMETGGEFAPEDVEFMMESLIDSCERTGWSAAAKTCFAGASSATQACQASLTEDQGNDFRQAMGIDPGD